MDDKTEITDLLRQFATRHDPDRLDDALEWLAPHDESVIGTVADALSDKDAEVGLLAVEILRELGPKAETVLPAMIGALEDKDRIVRLAASFASPHRSPRRLGARGCVGRDGQVCRADSGEVAFIGR
jgi:HEAT repeat protein